MDLHSNGDHGNPAESTQIEANVRDNWILHSVCKIMHSTFEDYVCSCCRLCANYACHLHGYL